VKSKDDPSNEDEVGKQRTVIVHQTTAKNWRYLDQNKQQKTVLPRVYPYLQVRRKKSGSEIDALTIVYLRTCYDDGDDALSTEDSVWVVRVATCA
jgi:hypothetical protein